jgi:large subunit ribosomal protein L27
MASKTANKTAKNNRDSAPKHLRVIKYGKERVKAGNGIVTQRGTKYYAGNNTILGRTHTVHAIIDGIVRFQSTKRGMFIHVDPITEMEKPKKTRFSKKA